MLYQFQSVVLQAYSNESAQEPLRVKYGSPHITEIQRFSLWYDLYQ